MESNKLIPVETFYLHYHIETSFLTTLYELQVVELTTIEDKQYVATHQLPYVEKLIRLHHDFDMDINALSVAAHLLDKIDALHTELNTLRSRLKLYEE